MVDEYVKGSKHKISFFAEDKAIIEVLKPYPSLSANVVSRLNLQPCEGLMFFDYPSSEELYDEILVRSEATVVHYMKYDVIKFDLLKMLKTFSGMIKYVANNKNGEFNISGCASFLSVTEKVVRVALELFAENGSISVDALDEPICLITLHENIDATNLMSLPKYKVLSSEILKMDEFRKSMMKREL